MMALALLQILPFPAQRSTPARFWVMKLLEEKLRNSQAFYMKPPPGFGLRLRGTSCRFRFRSWTLTLNQLHCEWGNSP